MTILGLINSIIYGYFKIKRDKIKKNKISNYQLKSSKTYFSLSK